MKINNKLHFSNSVFKTNLILPSLSISLGLLLLYIPFLGTQVKAFDRTLGNGILNGVDITKRINNISFFDFLLVPAILFFIYFAISILCKNINEKNNECVNFINTISIVSLPALIFAHINKFSSKDFLSIEVILPCFIIVLGIIFLIVSKHKVTLKFQVFKWCVFATIPVTLLVTLIFRKFNVTVAINKFPFLDTTLNSEFSVALNNVLNIGLFTAIFGVLFAIIFLTTTLCYERISFSILKKSYIPVIIAPIVTSLFLELTNILNQQSIFINSKFGITFIIYIIFGITFVGYYLFCNYNKKFSEEFCFEKFYYPLLLITFSLIAVQPSLQSALKTDFFEQSNNGTAISEMFNFGKIPIIQTFDAHMLQNEIGSILYGLLNNDFQGAIFLGYSLLPLFVVLYYFLFIKFFNKDISFFLMLMFPITSENTFTVFSLAPIVILSFLYAYKAKTYKAYLLHWISIAFACLFRLDMGFSLAFASITVWGIMWLLKKNMILIRKLVLSCIYVIISGFVTFVGICLLKSISPLQRMIEFLKLCESNINWAYSSLGNTAMTAFVFSYFIVPSITTTMIFVFIFKKWENKELVSDEKFIITLIIGLLCVFNLSRGIVRHSLVENKNIYIVSSAPLFISMFIYIFKKKNKLLSFIISNTIFMIILSLTINLNSIFPRSLINSAISKYLTFEPYNTISSEKKERVVISDDMKKIYLPLKNVLNRTLLSNETYIDFTNQTLLYALTGREKPMYINQSPGLLSGEYTQQRFINQCEQVPENVPFVLMPIEPMLLSTDLDGIQNSYRYYLISEYISNNFKPLFRTSKFAVWCRKDRFYEKADLVSKLIADNNDLYSKISLSEGCTKDLNGHNENTSVVNNQLILKSIDVDPYLIGLDKLINIKEISSNVSYMNISIEYESDKDGLFELFYTTDKGEDFNPQKVVSRNLPGSGVFEAEIPCTEDTKIRFDIPEKSNVKIKNISVKGIKDLYSDNISFIDYNYLPIDNHTYHMINIPYIWANYDKIGIDKKEEQLVISLNSSIYNFSSINKQYGNYLFVNASSVSNGTMTVQLGKDDGNGFTKLSQFDFLLKEGKNQKYLIRLSSDFMWYSDQINSIKIASDNNSTIDKISVLKGDTLK